MSPLQREHLRRDLDLIERFSASYDRRFREIIGRLNAPAGCNEATAAECLRLCIEATHMLLSTQAEVSTTLRELLRQQPGLPMDCARAA